MGKKTLKMYLLYNLLLFLFYPFFLLLTLLHPKLRATAIKRKHDLTKLLATPFQKEGKVVIWFHSASVGELDQARALAKTIKEKSKNAFILQSVYSSSVTEKHLDDSNFDLHFLLPFDFPLAYRKIFRKFKPDILMILAWDTWPNLIRSSKQFATKTYLACASLSSTSGRSKGIMKLLTRDVFSYLDAVFVTHEIQLPEFKSLLGDKTILEVLGDTRFDSVLNRIEQSQPTDRFQSFLRNHDEEIQKNPPVLLGSTYPICESYLLDFLKGEIKNESNAPFWIFPHKWEENRMFALESNLSSFGSVSRFSEVLEGRLALPRFLLFDEMGILAFAYKYARFAYVGGGFHHRIHNTIEPAAWGLALFTGPRIQNASEAIVMQKLGGLIACTDGPDYVSCLMRLLQQKMETERIGRENRKFVLENRGASERIYLRVFSHVLS
jgi:3-deoxy-D-manno-octulosonic-acid transferase